MTNVGCTSSNDDSTDVEAADGASSELADEGAALDEGSADEGSADEGADVATADDSGDEFADDSGTEGSDDFATDEEVVADTGDEEAVDDGTVDESTPSTDTAATDELPADSMDNGDSSSIVAEDGTAQEGTELADGSVSEAPPTEEGVFDNAPESAPEQDTSSYASAADTNYDSGYSEAPKNIPVKKIAEAPYNKNGVLVNTVYLGRQGDTLKSIAAKIGTTKGELLKVNPNLSNGVKVGDKVYYNSPKRPQDSEKMLTYYEDNGLAPQSYVAQAGDNIRVVSKTLLGDKNSWKEIWATNLVVESKSELPAGTELRYWPDSSTAMPTMAAAPTPAPEAPQMPEPTPEAPIAANDTAATPGAPQDDFALPDDTATNGAAAGTVANAEPPPPPPPPPAAPQKAVASNDEKDLTFMLSAGGLLLVGVGVLLGIIRKGRSRKMSMNTHTQI